jgi:hypothetical protein
MIEAYVEAGLTKFVIRPAVPSGNASGLSQFIDEFAAEMLPLEN